MKILVFGSMNIDHVYRVDHTVRPGETISARDYSAYPGGKGLNQSVALARAGMNVYTAGLLGQEGGFLKALLEENGVDTRFIRFTFDPTGHAVIQITPEGQNAIFVFGGTNRQITEGFIDATLAHFSAGDVLVCQNEISAMARLIPAASERGMTVALNPSPMDGAMTEDLIKRADYLYVNEIEAMALTGMGTMDLGLIEKGLTALNSRAQWLLTLGADGALSIQKNSPTLRRDAFRVEAVDTTGAGDTFLGYHLAAALSGGTREEALLRGTAAAALAVTRPGASSSIPRSSEVDRFLAGNM